MKLMLNGKEVTGMVHYVMAGDIKDATAEDSNVLSGKVYYNNNGKREGTMPNRGGMSAELSAGGSVSIQEGYHNGEGVVRAQDLASQTQGTAAAANIEAGYTAWVNGSKVTGTLTGLITVVKNLGVTRVKTRAIESGEWTHIYLKTKSTYGSQILLLQKNISSYTLNNSVAVSSGTSGVDNITIQLNSNNNTLTSQDYMDNIFTELKTVKI